MDEQFLVFDEDILENEDEDETSISFVEDNTNDDIDESNDLIDVDFEEVQKILQKRPLLKYLNHDGIDMRNEIIESDLKNLVSFTHLLSKRDIGMIWILGNNITDYRDVSEFLVYSTQGSFLNSIKSFQNNYINNLEKEKIFLQNLENLSKKSTEDTLPNFNVYGQSVGFQVPLPIQYTVTEDVPIAKLGDQIQIWREQRDVNIFDAIAYSPIVQDKLLFLYDENNLGVVRIDSGFANITVNIKRTDRIMKQIQKFFMMKTFEYTPLNLKGEFTIPGRSIDRRIMALLLVEKDYYGNMILFDEKERTLAKKQNFQVKIPTQLDYEKPVYMTFTNMSKDLKVRLSKVPNEDSIEKFQNIFFTLYSDYTKNYDSLVKQYKSFGSLKFTKADIVKKKEGPTATITKQRLNELRKQNPVLFAGNDYARLCPGENQPIPALGDKITELKENAPEKILEYPTGSDQYYYCNITEAKKQEAKPRQYPGLILDSYAKRRGEEKEYKYVPCCYPINQYRKAKSKLNAYLTGTDPDSQRVSILDKGKRLAMGRKGKLPTILTDILAFHGIRTDRLLRYGVEPSKQSILSCISKVTKESVETIRENLLKSNVLYSCVQTYTIDKIREIIQNPDMELLSENFMIAMQYYTNSTVLLIEGDEFSRPKAKFGYMPDLTPRKSLIILYKHKNYQQTEILGTVNGKFSFRSDKFVEKVEKSKRIIYNFQSNKKYIYPNYRKFLKHVKAQYVDEFGKCRGFLINGQTIFMAPIAPIDKPIISKVFVDNPKIFKTYKYEDEFALYTERYVIPKAKGKSYGYPLPPDDYDIPYILTTNSFFRRSYNSELKANQLMRRETTKAPRKAIDAFVKWRSLGIRKPLKMKLLSDLSNVIVLKGVNTFTDYSDLLHTYSTYRWEDPVFGVHSPGKLHHYVLSNGKYIRVLDTEQKPVSSPSQFGLYDVATETLTKGNGILRYVNGKYGMIL